jgi:PIN domain nuclease of toxin-antitoxin system
VTLLDAYAVVALVADEPAAEQVEGILREGGSRVVIVNLAEAIDIAGRVRAIPIDDIRVAIEPLLISNVLAPAISDEPQGWLAAEIRGTYYHRRTSALSMADCLLLAHGVTDGGPIATSDGPVANAAEALGIGVVRLPDSAGERP